MTACRGLGISDDEAHYIADLIPVERGTLWSITDCLEGNLNTERKPVGSFKQAVAQHDDKNLAQTILSLENIITGRSIHASAQYIFSNGYLSQNSLMRAPNGTKVTAFNMTDSDIMGGLKFDLLAIKALDKLHASINALIETGRIEDKGSIRANYDAYLHPDVLEYDSSDMWEKVGKGAINDLFQFDTAVGGTAVVKIKPNNIHELAVANALMRLQAAPGEPSPIDVYVSHKGDINLWYDEMRSAGLSEEDITVLEPYLKKVYGVSSLQEEIMLISMDEKISGFTVAEANKLRKAIAKKKPKVMEEVKELFYKKGAERGTSKALLDYIWNVQVHYQAGYAFNISHCIPYSIIALQEMNIVEKYGALFWNVGCLTVNAGANDTESQETTEYGKISAAINDLSAKGQEIELPYVNKAQFGFSADVENNKIIFGLKAIKGISDAQAKEIIAKRPFSSFNDFLERTGDVIKPSHVIALIKSGALSEIDDRGTRRLMRDYLATQANTVKKLTVGHLDELIRRGIVSKEEYPDAFTAMELADRYKAHVSVKGNTPGKTWLEVDDDFFRLFAPYLKEGRDYRMNMQEGYYEATQTAIKRAKEKVMQTLKETVLSSTEALNKLNEARITDFCRTKAPGTTSKWEMDTLLFYHGPHELQKMDMDKYHVSNFDFLPFNPTVNHTYKHKNGRTFTTHVVTRLAGTVLDRDKTKHIVTLLTLDGVVLLKFSKDAFAEYNQQLSKIMPDGSKQVLEAPWFTRGNKLLVTGFRRENQFVVRTYNDSPWKAPVALISDIDPVTGDIKLKTERG